ncbi:MAG TPA: hypothetical protein VHZ77_00090 [Gaiellaceae bacterium]|nr:hypothetical protein [Gaiellaceae bacterium]
MKLPARLTSSGPFPWARPRHELLLLGLVALAMLSIMRPPGAQDTSRMCLTRALVHGHLSADTCLDPNGDRAAFGGHLYSDKPPGISVFAIPMAQAVRLPGPSRWSRDGDVRLWAVRLSTGGIALLVCALLVGRVAEGLAPRWGGAVLVTFATGTLAGSLAVDNFEEVPAAALAFASFLLAWRRRPGLAGLVAGAMLLVQYQSGLIGAVVCVYVALSGVHALGRYALGAVPGVALLGLYNRLAFGSPFHLSFKYVSPYYRERQSAGFFGIHAPPLHHLALVLGGSRGLIVEAPVLLAAALGLVLLWRHGYRAESCVCAAVSVIFVLFDAGYFEIYGGDSPGPRYVIPAIPFLLTGLGPAFARFRAFTALLAAASVIASTAMALTWPGGVNAAQVYRWSVWRELASLPVHGSHALIATWAQPNILGRLELGHLGSAAIVMTAALLALGVALRDGWKGRLADAR